MDLPSHDFVARPQLSQTVAIYVRELIISGKVRRGEFLRIESIAKAMQISSTPVREGLLLLQLEGFVRLSPRRGFMVVGVSRQDVLDIFWAQAVLAGELAARAALHASDAQKDEINRLLRAHAAAVKSQDEAVYTRLGHQFHRAINIASGAQRLAILLGTLTKQLPNRFYGMMEGQVQGALDYHPQIEAAIQASNAESARDLMRDHIMQGGQFLVEYLEAQGIWTEIKAEPKPLGIEIAKHDA